ncbi:MAG: NAD(P)H-hydrate dehydratase [Pseudomonadota bacterium]
MSRFRKSVYTVDAIRAIDRRAIDECGIDGYELMQRAAAFSLQAIKTRFSEFNRLLIVCGSGNNAGDGYVLARLARSDEWQVKTLAVTDPTLLSGDAARAYIDWVSSADTDCLTNQMDAEESAVVVDAIFGNGLNRPLEGKPLEAVKWINTLAAPVVSLDIPTGLNGDSGEILGDAVRAELTTTYVGLKAGLYLQEGPDHCGEVVLDDLQISKQCFEQEAPLLRKTDPSTSRLPVRKKQAHKGSCGHVLIAGGAPGMLGAVLLAGKSALRAGAGKVTVATDRQHASMIALQCPELMGRSVESATDLTPLIEAADVVVLGPGLGASQWSRALFYAVVRCAKTKVLDADALNILAESPIRRDDWVLTPHPGEAATLLSVSSGDIQRNRLQAHRDLVNRYGGVVVLKGAGTLSGGAGEQTSICGSGNPGMATAGMGDALTGIIAALIAQGMTTGIAAETGVEIHAQAGDRAAESGEIGLMTSDLIDAIRSVIAKGR